ncbi:hypothetical protein AG1IA_07765 [Rhizoctonia solani AG-1 IA]|uniref:Uncharacterized protein n=1 Tax=Thanatephorus cucumeris (strain AG1-IA) TaxID=983506 RepID=L8WJW6_THACA|nr:hypothetical protein AG1IA_07765 [Rhizoctonia solani AG-1 IA]
MNSATASSPGRVPNSSSPVRFGDMLVNICLCSAVSGQNKRTWHVVFSVIEVYFF